MSFSFVFLFKINIFHDIFFYSSNIIRQNKKQFITLSIINFVAENTVKIHNEVYLNYSYNEQIMVYTYLYHTRFGAIIIALLYNVHYIYNLY